MAFRFQKRIKVLPGVSINLSKSGVSTSVGPRGAKVTMGHGKRRLTVGLPGTGLSSTHVTSTKQAKKPNEAPETKAGMGFGTLLLWGIAALFGFMVIGGLAGLI